jgi:protein-tyrosine-phosphatase
MRILFVCSGNICRSPFAETLARDLSDRADIEFASAGTIALKGNPASATGIAVAAELGVDLSDHRATHLTAEVLASADLVYAMEEEHVASVLGLDPGARVELLSRDGDPMPDPYGGDRIEYLASYSLIAAALEDRLSAGDKRPG